MELLMQVADFGSFSKAAAVLGIAQPALGRQVQKLEEECGIRLLYRHGRGVSLTPAGQLLLVRARPLVRQLEALAEDLHAENEAPQGTVILGLTPTISNLLGIRLLKTVRDKYPRVNVNIVSAYSGYTHEWLVDGRLDIAVLHDARRSATVAVDPIGVARLFLVTHPEAKILAKRKKALSLVDLEGVPLTLSSQNHGLRRTMELAAGQAGITLNIVYEVDALALAKDLVVSGMASTVLARPAYLTELRQGSVREMAIEEPLLETRLMIAEASNRPVTRAMRVVRQEIQSIMEALTSDARNEFGLSRP
ncbi:LysR family transcriptional regulator [Cupriavidus taiwanensis]|uniref:LysR family transcriptional regulator n=1 Tax=Cupriavidus taiwanensis TaxID=164546 RepID=UPI00253F72F8|nr:LysR family transcriptional regulator [Cupriavidus taiwanensis]MDK3022651.1 LysR family transcriptional regulator [Cupriavidus taiwanensis]